MNFGKKAKDVAFEEGAAPKKKSKKLPIALGALAAIVVVAGAGFMVWHEKPSFCGAICHTPMDPYLATYEAEPGQSAIDKWGNEVEDAGAMTAAFHRTEGFTCLDCHEPTMSQQISEGLAWVSGSYEVEENETYGVVAVERSLKELAEAQGTEPEAMCLNEACHVNADGSVMTEDDLAALTAEEHGHRNPHVDYHGNTTCSDCHKAHRASVNDCSSCHADSVIPDGWINGSQAKKLAA